MSGEPGRWRTFGERELHRSPDVWFGQIDVELADGERVWEYVLRIHRVASLALVDDVSRVLLAWRHRYLADRWGWELPAGLVDEGEDPAEAATRIGEDMTGYRPGRVEPLIAFRPMAETVDCEQAVFVGRDLEQVGQAAWGGDIARADWVPLGSVPELVSAGEIWHGGTLVALLRLLTLDGQITPQ
jgi:8-oxo-dGDP phosphatase